ncbi:MAG: ubiquitin-like domain-containing protein [Actinomycetota bacterium]|nr:ubiquitin-like domain-containing protein [Actinomycetota bacterium]
MRRRVTAIVLQTLVLASLVAATAGLAVAAKRVTLLLDGTPRVLTTQRRTVGGVLAEAGITVGRHDLLAPDRDVAVTAGSYVVLRRGRQVTITIDGQPRRIWVTARSVEELLAQIGLRGDGMWVSASRSRGIGLNGIALQLRLPKEAMVVADGKAAVLNTTVATVGELLDLAHITLGPTDRASLPPDALVTDGLLVTVTRIRGATGLVNVATPPPIVRKPDPTLVVGQIKVLDPGVPGVTLQTWRYVITNGKVTAKRLISAVVTTQPRVRILAVGTKPAPAPSADGLNWAALARCESGGNPRAVNPAGYYGLYQFSVNAWRSVGGSGLPSDAAPSEQTYRAQLLYQRSGAGQWPNCGKYLFT